MSFSVVLGILKGALGGAATLLQKQVKVYSVLLVLGLVGVSYMAYKHWTKPSDLEGNWTQKMNDSTIAVVAKNEPVKNAVTEAAKTLKGKVVAGATIITAPETVFVQPREVIESTVLPDSTREAVLNDSTAQGYKIKITAIAPPFPQNLKIGYEFIVPSFHPEIGFVKAGNTYAAVVSWAGKTFEVKDAFVVPAERRVPTWGLYGQGEALYDVTDRKINTPALSLNLEKKVNNTAVVLSGQVNFVGHPAIGIQIKKYIWSK